MIHLHTLIISPKYRPSQDGLSDYVYFFLNQLKKENCKVNLVTSDEDEIKEFAKNDQDVFPIIKRWDFLGPMKLMSLILEKNPQYILIEYVPQMYGRAGLNFFFPYYVFVMKYILRKKVILRAHELYHPFEYNIKTGILFIWHIWNLLILLISSDKTLTTTENFIKILRRFPGAAKKIHLLPVGPNIQRSKAFPVKTDIKNLILFGSLHASRKTSLVLTMLCDYFKNNPHHSFHLQIIGATKEEIINQLHDVDLTEHHYLLDKTSFHGKLSEEKVAELFCQGHFSINYFVDGISCRRGSAIAALNLGLPIITNYTERSDAVFLNQPMIFILENNQLQLCLKKIESISAIEYEDLRLKSYHFVDENFSWNIIVKLYLEYIKC